MNKRDLNLFCSNYIFVSKSNLIKMLKIGVLGAGHLGKIHLNILKESDFASLIGFYDPSEKARKEAEENLNVVGFNSMEELIEKCDIIDIVTPTNNHFECAKSALQSSKHVFIEKPVTNTLDEVKSLIKLAEEAGTKIQVGHVERFNPAFKEANKFLDNPMFIETHRLAQFNPRGTDVSVVLDLMIHDIDILLSIVNHSINKISASGVAVISDTPDIANARIEFSNGCVANLTASRLSLKNMRKSRFFQKDAYISVDFLEKKFEIIRMEDTESPDPFLPVIDLGEKGKKQIYIISEKPEAQNAIEEELKSFVNSIQSNSEPIVDLYSAQMALQLATDISKQIKITYN